MKTTIHGESRLQQRGIKLSQAEAVIEFGRYSDAGKGRERVFMGKHEVKKAKRKGCYQAEKLAGIELIVEISPTGDSTIITGYRKGM